MESVRYLFPLIILSLINPSEQGLFDYFKLKDWSQNYMTSNVTLRSTKDYKNVTLCTLWNEAENKDCSPSELIPCIYDACKSCDKTYLKDNCQTELNTTIYVYHFRCLLAELLNVTSQTEVLGCQNFGDEINMVIKLWNDLTLDPAVSSTTPTKSTPGTSTEFSPTTWTTPSSTTTTSPSTKSTKSSITSPSTKPTKSSITSSSTKSTTSSSTKSTKSSPTVITSPSTKSAKSSTSLLTYLTKSPTTKSPSAIWEKSSTTITTSSSVKSTKSSTSSSTKVTKSSTSASPNLKKSSTASPSTKSSTATTPLASTVGPKRRARSIQTETTCLACHGISCETSNSESRTEEKTIWNSIMACFLVISVFGNVIQAVHSYQQRRRYESRPSNTLLDFAY